MLRVVLICILAASPGWAQDESEGRDLMSEALRLFMKGLLQEVEPAIDDFSSFLDNIDAYHPPEVLPNGDIIIRRKVPVENPEGEIEL